VVLGKKHRKMLNHGQKKGYIPIFSLLAVQKQGRLKLLAQKRAALKQTPPGTIK
jgi:hypothetical protein